MPWCLALGVFLFSGCLKDNDYTRIPSAGLYMFNGYPDASGLAIYLDQNHVRSPYNPLIYRGVDYANAYTGNRRLRILTPNGELLADSTLVMRDSMIYSSFMYGRQENPKHVITEDRAVSGLENGQSAVRFLNLADVAGAISLTIGDEEIPSFSSRPTETQSSATANESFVAKSSGNHTLIIKDAAGNELARRENVSLVSELYYTIILVGIDGNENMPLYIGIARY